MKIILASTLLGVISPFARADINWPEYSQQCTDDAGPPFEDDVPGVKYHAGSAAYPVLVNGECAEPLQAACASRPDFKTAYLEGPISCGNNGWYCRIFNDEANGWDNINLNTDVNFGECNKEESFEGPWYDQDGHCHGSSYDNTYYWWIRDHWYRQYNGRVRCCCGWYTGSTQPVTQGRIANRCDYRRQVTQEENLSNCRDANEGHGLGYDPQEGCDNQYILQIGSTIPEDDSVCWEIERFGYTEEGGSIPTQKPTLTPKPTPPVSTASPTNSPTESLVPTSPAEPVPTKSPTKEPTSGPSSKPTAGPTREPTTNPSSLPTRKPTKLPTPSPTLNPTPSPAQVSEEVFRAVVCGRGYDCAEGDGFVDVVNMNDAHEVRCCRDCVNDGPCGKQWKQKCSYDPEVYARSKFGGTCYEVDFCSAMDVCAQRGARLCTPEEVLESCTQGTGCGFDREMIWACMWDTGGCEADEECCSGQCSRNGECLPAEAGMCP